MFKHEGLFNAWPSWVNLKSRKTAFANRKNRPGVDYPSVAYTPVVEAEPTKENSNAVEAS